MPPPAAIAIVFSAWMVGHLGRIFYVCALFMRKQRNRRWWRRVLLSHVAVRQTNYMLPS